MPQKRRPRNLLLAITAAALVSAFGIPHSDAAVQFWRTDGTTGQTWTGGPNWSATATPTGGSSWVSASDADFAANSTLTFATTAVGNVTVADGATVTVTTAGTLTLGGVRTFNIGTGSTLTWTSQGQSTAAGNEGAGIIKTGAGILNLGAIGTNARYDGGFTLGGGTVIASGNNTFGTGPMSITAGTLQTSGGNTYNSSGLTIGGDFTFAGTGTDIWNAATSGINIGGTTHTITNSMTASNAVRNLAGVITGTGTAGLAFNGTGLGVITLSNTNNFSGGITLGGTAEVGISSITNIGSGNITFNGGILQITGTTLNNVDSRIANPTTFTGGFDIASTSNPFTLNLGLSGSGSLSKFGAGTLNITSPQFFSGNTTITAGTLQLTSNGFLNSPKITIGTSTSSTALATLDVSTLSPFNVGPITLAGNNGAFNAASVTLGGHTMFLEDFTNDVAAVPVMKFTGNLTLSPGASVVFNGSPDGVSNYVLATYAGTLTGNFDGTPPAGYTIDYGTLVPNQITLVSSAPEPASLAILALGGAALLRRRRK